MHAYETLVALTGMFLSFGLPLALVAVILFYKHRRQRMIHDTIAQLAERGAPVPPELLLPPRSHHAGLRGGLVLVALGIALWIFLREVGAPASIGFIPGLMGVALLLSWFIETRSDRNSATQPR